MMATGLEIFKKLLETLSTLLHLGVSPIASYFYADITHKLNFY